MTEPADLKHWQRYRIEANIGRGGMAEVFRAWDPRLKRHLAVKLLFPWHQTSLERFVREAETQARIEHDNVLRVYETGEVEGRQFIAMQYVDGPTLMEVRDNTNLEEKVRLVRQVAAGVHAAHRQGLVHRDIKPSNILVENGPDGLKPYVADFGLAADLDGEGGLTVPGTVLGTPFYMAPERLAGSQTLDRRSDVYSLGATLYEFLVGRRPYASPSTMQILVDMAMRDARPPSSVDSNLPPELDAIVMKCLEREPGARYASARALAEDLGRYLDGEPVRARPVGPMTRLVKKARRHPALAAAFTVAFLVIAALGGWAGAERYRAARQAELARQLGQEVRDIEWMVRVSHMLPLDALAANVDAVRRRMDALRRSMEDLGTLAAGPRHDALGRGALALGDPDTAFGHLEAAWDAGYRGAATASALGLALGEIYRRELVRARRIGDDTRREARLRDIEARYRDRALELLRQGRVDTDGGADDLMPAEYVEALLAFYEGSYVEAERKAGLVFDTRPWLFEALILRSDASFERAIALFSVGDQTAAAQAAVAADRDYAQAAEIAASSAAAHLGRCSIAGLIVHMALHDLDWDVETTYGEAEEACRRALVIDDNAETHYQYSILLMGWATWTFRHGGDPSDAYQAAEEQIRAAMGLDRGEAEYILHLADLHLRIGAWERDVNRDPGSSFAASEAAYRQAQDLDPTDPTAWNNLSMLYRAWGHYDVGRGGEPSANFGRGVEAARQALVHDSRNAFAYRNLIDNVTLLSQARRDIGQDPCAGLKEVARFLAGLPDRNKVQDQDDATEALRQLQREYCSESTSGY